MHRSTQLSCIIKRTFSTRKILFDLSDKEIQNERQKFENEFGIESTKKELSDLDRIQGKFLTNMNKLGL
jgi:hypothetical protein